MNPHLSVERVMQTVLIVWPILLFAFLTLALLVYVFAVALPRLRSRKGGPTTGPATRRH